MKQTSETAVQPRRNVLAALWVWVVGLWGATELLASSSKATKPATPKPQLERLVGRLCMDEEFRTQFFSAQSNNLAISAASSRGMQVTQHVAVDAVAKMRAAHNSPNPVEDACKEVGKQLTSAGISLPCNPWPC